SREVREPDENFLQMLPLIGSQLGQFIERKKAEELLSASESRLSLALAASHMGAWEWDMRTGKVTWSPSLEEIHGLKPGTFGGTFQDFERDIYPDDLESVLAHIKESLASGTGYHVVYRVKRGDGSMRWLEAFGKAILGAGGEPERMVGMCMDITP